MDLCPIPGRETAHAGEEVQQTNRARAINKTRRKAEEAAIEKNTAYPGCKTEKEKVEPKAERITGHP